MLTTTQGYGTSLSDLLFIQRPEMLYVLAGVLLVVGLAFWFLGHQIHRIFLTVVLLAIGTLIGWHVPETYGLHGVHAVLAVAVGGLLGAGLGYWLFRLWLGILASALIAGVLLTLFSWSIAVPRLEKAAEDARMSLAKQGLELSPGPSRQKPLNLPVPRPSVSQIPDPGSSLGRAYQGLQDLVPKLSRAKYPDWQTWQQQFPATARGVWDHLATIIPGLTRDISLIAGIGLIIGLVLAGTHPLFLDIAYTALLGIVLLLVGGVVLLVPLKDTGILGTVAANPWLSLGVVAVSWLIGVVVQYYMLPSPPAPEDAEGSKPAPEKPQGDKKKK